MTAYRRASFSSSKSLPKYSENYKTSNVVLVTGGTKGIGAEIVKKYAVQGAKVIATYSHDEQNAEALRQLLLKEFYSAEFVKCDVSSKSECEKLYDYLKLKYKSIDVMYIRAALAPHNIELYNETYSAFESYINKSMQMFYYPMFTFLDLIKEKGKLGIFSSIALSDKKTNRRMIEYICAKSILENTVESISYSEQRKNVDFYIIRAPKMLTEMNNTPIGRLEAFEPKTIAEKIFIEIEKNQDKEENLIYLNF